MLNKFLLMFVVVSTMFVSGCAFSQHHEYREGKVIGVEMVKQESIIPVRHEQCRTVKSHSNAGRTIVGGVVGAAIGRQFGGGSGRDIATALGALGGMIVGNETGERPRYHEECITVTEYESHYTYGNQYQVRVLDNNNRVAVIRMNYAPELGTYITF